MTVARPRAKKPTAIDETVRVLRIFDYLRGELAKKADVTYDMVLAVAERIAARTSEDGR